MSEKPILTKIDKLKAHRDEQAQKVEHYTNQLKEFQSDIERLIVEMSLADELKEPEVRALRDKALRNREACRKILAFHQDRLANFDERLDRQTSKLEAVRSKYVESYTTGAAKNKEIAAMLKAQADEEFKEAERKSQRMNELAEQVLKEKIDGYGHAISDEEAVKLSNALKVEASRQRALLSAEAKLTLSRAERLLFSIEDEQAKARTQLMFHGGPSEIERADEVINGLKLK